MKLPQLYSELDQLNNFKLTPFNRGFKGVRCK
jgi:hypothetical protein